MNSWFRASILFTCFCLALASTTLLAQRISRASEEEGKESGPPVADLVRKASEELLEIQNKIRSLETDAAERRKTAERRLRELEGEKRAVEQIVAKLKDQVANRQKELDKKKELLGEKEKEIARLQYEARSISESYSQFLKRIEEKVEQGILWKVDQRRSEIQQARELISRSDASLAEGLAAIRRVQEEEEALGRLMEAGYVELELESEYLAVPAFHLGHLAVVFANEDGTIAGFAKRGQKLEEGLITGEEKSRIARGYLMAIDILRQRRTPQVIEFFIPTLPKESEVTK